MMSSVMDSTPPSRRSEPRLRIKSASRFARTEDFGADAEDIPHFSVEVIPSSPNVTLSPSLLSRQGVPLQELLLLSPSSHSPLRRSKSRLNERTEMAEEPIDQLGSRRRCKSRASSMAVLGCASPRNGRRTRRRLEQEIREEKDVGLGVEIGKARRRKSTRSCKENPSIVPSVRSPKTGDDDPCNLDHIWQLISDQVMWKDVAKSSLWFGFGSLCFLSSCFTRGLNFSIISAVSQLGLLFLGASFFFNSISQSHEDHKKQEFKLKEDDILRVARVMLPAANLVIAKTKELFSGEPSMTLKAAPILLFGAEYGHLITLWRLCATGFFVSFTAPKLYSCHSEKIKKQVENWRSWMREKWVACSRKKIVAASAATVLWNLSSLKTRMFAVFILLVILRFHRQHSQVEVKELEGEKHQQQQDSVIVTEIEEQQQKQQALVVVAQERSNKSS
ncbi:PREDICTED: reticulon-like protein B17 isoform X2 [Nelumbo nucifera]|uniref:Reticulon-like protein n=1 Tax=Nelumbo nucifera TaxID=4432 RepID=A0A1U8AWF2_NELNU|nr:PREDICTED: reticulon-like protein B17 isoform X2 [Nelumbo nucifera]